MLIVVLLLFMIAFFFCWREEREHYNKNFESSCIITMTTFMGFRDRFLNVSNILDALLQTQQPIIVINEWDEDSMFYQEFMRIHYPTVHFIQKTQDEWGQARSLNILIRDHLLHSKQKYWIHWEDTWVCSRPLLPDLVSLMDQHRHVSQLQITGDWQNVDNKLNLGEISLLKPPVSFYDENQVYGELDATTWPLFSLRPSINRLSFFQRHGKDFYFLEDPHLWPLRFEWEFGRIFLRNKGVKAITNQPYAHRLKGHESTYQKLVNDYVDSLKQTNSVEY